MSTSTGWSRALHGRRIAHTHGLASALVVLLALVGAAGSGATPASAYWSGSVSTPTTAATATLSAPVGVIVPGTTTGDVPVSWNPGDGGVQPSGYYVSRNDGDTTAPACGSSPASLVDGDNCTDEGVPAGAYTYVVTAVYASWTARSTPSAPVTVTAPVLLGAAQSYSVLAATTVVSTGSTAVSGDLGVSPGTTVVGVEASAVGGDIHAGDQHAADAQTALATAYDDLSERPADAEIVGDLGGRTLAPGVYHSSTALALTGTLTLDAQGDPDAVFIIQSFAALGTAAASSVNLVNGAQAANVYWVVAGAAETGANSSLVGTLVVQGLIALGPDTTLIGRALSLNAVTLVSSTIRFTAADPPTLSIDGGPVATTRDTTPTITGVSSAPESSTVRVLIDGQSLFTTVAADGTWAVTAAELSAGGYDVDVRVRVASGDGTSAAQELTVESNPPPIDLGAAGSYSVLAATGVINSAATRMSGDLGVSPSTVVTGFPPGQFEGSLHAGDLTAATAQQSLLAALDDASSRVPHTEVEGDLGGQVFHAGVHHSTAALALTGTVTLDGEGNPDAVFIFQGDTTFTTASASAVSLVNGAQAANVFWVVTGAAGTGADSSLSGAVLARGAITLGARTALTGQALSRGTVTLTNSSLTGITPAPLARQVPLEESPDALTEPRTPPSPLPEAPEKPDTREAPDATAPPEEAAVSDETDEQQEPSEQDQTERGTTEAPSDRTTVTP